MLLVVMVVLAAITATLKTHHIGLRSPATKIDFRVYSIAMLFANGLLTSSTISQYRSVTGSGVPVAIEMQVIYWLWITLFAILTLISLFQLIKSPTPTKEGESWACFLKCATLCLYGNYYWYCIYFLYGLSNGTRYLPWTIG